MFNSDNLRVHSVQRLLLDTVHLSIPGVSKFFDLRATYDFVLQIVGQRTQILRSLN
jgi:hypothetical protein